MLLLNNDFFKFSLLFIVIIAITPIGWIIFTKLGVIYSIDSFLVYMLFNCLVLLPIVKNILD